MKSVQHRVWTAAVAALGVLAGGAAAGTAQAAGDEPIDAHRFRVIARESGPVDYYTVIEAPDGAYVRAEYKPPYATTVLGVAVPDGERRAFHEVRWKWRALALPAGGNECVDATSDSAAVVYLTWKRGLRWYTLKYTWSAGAPKGSTCERKRNPLVAQDTVVLESGGRLGEWVQEGVNLDAEFRRHFEGNDPKAEVPDFVGLAIMTDGDQTKSVSAADYGDFVLAR